MYHSKRTKIEDVLEGIWTFKMSDLVYCTLYKIVEIKLATIRWVGFVTRMEEMKKERKIIM